MQFFEIPLAVVAFAWAARSLRTGRVYEPESWLMGLLLCVLLLLHAGVEGYRWQMIPVYGVALGALALMAPRFVGGAERAADPTPGARLAGVAGLLLTGVGATAAYLLPVPALPAPGGPYKVGSSVYVWEDDSRETVYAGGETGPRKIVAQIWYPASPAKSSKRMAWMHRTDEVGPAIAGFFGLPKFILNHLNLVQLNAWEDAPIAETAGKMPVIVYSHGWRGFRVVNADQLESLASHGYAVVSLDHLHGAMGTVFPDGTVEPLHPDLMPKDTGDAVYQAGIERLVDMYADDLSFVLDRLAGLANGKLDARFKDRLDLDRVGLFGHSTGGGAVVEVCARDPRCKACFGQDIWIEPVSDDVFAASFDKPLLMMNSESWSTGDNRDKQQIFFDRATGDKRLLSVVGSNHNDFVMTGLFSPLAGTLGMKGPIDGARMMEINREYLRAFFDLYLCGKPAPLLEDEAAFPEVRREGGATALAAASGT
ncbi:MAG: carboxylic ester hydrolase [Candidatus Hydrogenedentota bacterium]